MLFSAFIFLAHFHFMLFSKFSDSLLLFNKFFLLFLLGSSVLFAEEYQSISPWNISGSHLSWVPSVESLVGHVTGKVDTTS